MKIREMRAICRPLGIEVECKWSYGFIVGMPKDCDVLERLHDAGFRTSGIGIGFDYNRGLYFLYAEKLVENE